MFYKGVEHLREIFLVCLCRVSAQKNTNLWLDDDWWNEPTKI